MALRSLVISAGLVIFCGLPIGSASQEEVDPTRAARRAPALSEPTFETFLEGVRAEALSRGIKQETLDTSLTGLTPLPVVVARDRGQPEAVQSLESYLRQRVTRRTIATGRQMVAKHRTLLASVDKETGVSAAMIVAVWGLESNFGRFTGTYQTIRALATLAYDNRRPLFRTELLAALTMVDRGVAPGDMKGSWAGAMGQPQFMPSSFLQHAVDFDKDGRIDIWTTPADVFGSMGHYLQQKGWSSKARWGREVRVSQAVRDRIERQIAMRTDGCRAAREMTVRAPLTEWHALGVTQVNGAALPVADIDAALVRGQSRSFLVYPNYEALLGYNCSNSYAIAAGLLADAIGR